MTNLDVLYKKLNKSGIKIYIKAIAAGFFIGLGGALMLLIKADSNLSPSISAILSGMIFSVGLFFVIINGSELFTGDCLMSILPSTQHVRWGRIICHWILVYFGNLIGSISIATALWVCGFSEAAVETTRYKCALSFGSMFTRAIICNILVCLAVWMAMKVDRVIDKFIVILLPVMCFVALGFEHSIANMSIMTLGHLLDPSIDILLIVRNITVVTCGNIVGGAMILPVFIQCSQY